MCHAHTRLCESHVRVAMSDASQKLIFAAAAGNLEQAMAYM